MTESTEALREEIFELRSELYSLREGVERLASELRNDDKVSGGTRSFADDLYWSIK